MTAVTFARYVLFTVAVVGAWVLIIAAVLGALPWLDPPRT